jgi:hypothetical protein
MTGIGEVVSSRSSNGISKFLRERSNRSALIVLVLASLLLLVAVGNLVVVALDPVEVSPQTQEGESWSVGRDAGAEPDGSRLEWAFVVNPGNQRVVDLDVGIPYRVTVTHHDGQALLSALVSLYIDGERVARATHSISALPDDSGEAWVREVDLGQRMERVSIERESGGGPFGLLVTMDWSLAQADPESTRWDIEVGPVRVDPADLPGLWGCTSVSCAQVLFVVAVVAQGGGVFWTMQRWQASKKGSKGPQVSPAPRHR